MNVGFSSLTALKAQLLAPELRTRTTWDAQLTALGLGVAAAIEDNLGRKLTRLLGDTHTVPGDLAVISLPRYPLETVSAVAYRNRATEDWQDATGQLYTWSSAAGLAYLDGPLTDHLGQVRVIYSGGYWWDTSETTPDTQPVGSAALPAALFSAWLTQCRDQWRAMDPLGTSLAMSRESATQTPVLGQLALSPAVLAALAPYRRLAV